MLHNFIMFTVDYVGSNLNLRHKTLRLKQIMSKNLKLKNKWLKLYFEEPVVEEETQ